MKTASYSIFINHSFTHQIPSGPKVTIETNCILYKSKTGGYIADVEITDTTEIEVMGTKLSERPKVVTEQINESTGEKKEITAIRAFENQMDQMGIDISGLVMDEYIKQLTKRTVKDLFEEVGLVSGDDYPVKIATY